MFKRTDTRAVRFKEKKIDTKNRKNCYTINIDTRFTQRTIIEDIH